MSGEGIDRPPMPRCAFRVGIVGHRLDRLPTQPDKRDALSQTLHAILDQAQTVVKTSKSHEFASLYTGEPPILRAISPLAEGTDRIFAEEALDLGYELCCPFPFYQEEFEKDFTGANSHEANSLDHFRHILVKARNGAGLTIFEMNGDRDRASDAYGAAGRVVLNQSDILVVVWDGGQPRGGGGTVETLNEAIAFNVPVIWVSALHPELWQILRDPTDLPVTSESAPAVPRPDRRALKDAVAELVKGEISLPPQLEAAVTDAPSYFGETKPVKNFGFVWKMFRNLVSEGKTTFPVISLEDFESQIRNEWPVIADGGPRPSPVTDWINARLRVAFAWADGLADYYADAHRSAFIVSYFLAALAVFLALFPTLFELSQLGQMILDGVCGFFEIACLVGIIILLVLELRRHWHERWTDYRLMAELIRELRFLVPLGGKPSQRIPPHLALYGDPAQTWMYWYVRAIARETGVPPIRVTPDYMRDYVDFIDHVVGDEQDGQLGFHVRTYQRTSQLEKSQRIAANALLGATLAAVSLRVFLDFVLHAGHPDISLWDRYLLILAAVLPAIGAAVEGIGRQGEFIRISKRSAVMIRGFRKYAAKIAALKNGPPPRLADMVPLSSAIAETMVTEVVDWRAIITDRR